MSDPLLSSIALTGFSIAFLHAALPTHWLPFALAGKAQGWTGTKTLAVTAFASLGHILTTTILGALLIFLGLRAEEFIGHEIHLIAGGILIGFGLYYLWRHSRGMGCIACTHGIENAQHEHHDHDHGHHGHHHHTPPKTGSDRAIILGLFMMLAISPCEGFLPVYLSIIQYGWTGFVLFSAVLAAATMSGMLLFTFLTWHGLEKLRLNRLEKYDALIVGSLLCLLGAFVMIVEHH